MKLANFACFSWNDIKNCQMATKLKKKNHLNPVNTTESFKTKLKRREKHLCWYIYKTETTICSAMMQLATKK